MEKIKLELPKEKKFYPNFAKRISFDFLVEFGWFKAEHWKLLDGKLFLKEGHYITIFSLSVLKFNITLAITI